MNDPSTLYKSLSIEFRNILFLHVPPANSEIIKYFGITEFPTMLFQVDRESAEKVFFQGDPNYENLLQFLTQIQVAEKSEL